MSDEPLLAPTFLFRFAVPCRKLERGMSAGFLGDEFRIPSFSELDGRRKFADLRAAWSPQGMTFSVEVTGKKQPLWCRDSRFDDSDGLHIWLDTRDTHNIHRAGRFCHHFVFLPQGAGQRLDEPCARLLEINRARENPRRVEARSLLVKSETFSGGYRMAVSIPGDAITGYEPAEHPRLGYCYMICDRELGRQTFSLGPEFPIMENPTLWGTLELVGATNSSS